MNIFKWLTLELRNRYIRYMLDPDTQKKVRAKREQKRQREERPHEVYYFHQVNDPYSHLCAQILKPLIDEYDINLIPLVVDLPPESSTPEPQMYQQHSVKDATMIAPYFNLDFKPLTNEIDDQTVRLAQSILINTEPEMFADHAVRVGELIWSKNSDELNNMSNKKELIPDDKLSSILEKNDRTRKKMGHYFGGVFAYEGECYWGIDRLPYLEKRLNELGAKNNHRDWLIVKNESPCSENNQEPKLYIDIYWSLRSPYSYLAMKPLAKLRDKYNVELRYKIILPMVMRGMQINPEKGIYIIKDCKRIAEEHNIPFGNIIDPVGKAVERCYSMFEYAKDNHKEEEYLHGFAKSVWAEGKHGYLDSSLQKIINEIGLDWKEAKTVLDSPEWKADTTHNRETLFSLGKWGVPTISLVSSAEENLLTVWGQDRIWLIEETIKSMQE